MSENCLGHLKVLELCNLVAGPYCTKLLADLGAEVIKIEPPGIGDEARRRGPFLKDESHPEKSGLYLYLNTNKLGVTLDVRTKTGRSILEELVEQTDILVEDNPPSVMLELGLTYERLKEVNPGMVMTSITPFGQTGPYCDYKAQALNCFHAGGEGFMLPYESQYPEREPVVGGGLEPDCACGLHAALATLAAEYMMKLTGVGQHIDISKQDVLMTLVGLDITHYTQSGQIRNRHYRHSLCTAPVKCEDGYIMITPWPDPVWKKFALFVGNKEWAEDERYTVMVNRWQHTDELSQQIDEWVQQFQKEDLFNKLQKNGIAAAPVNTAEDIVKSHQMKVRDFFKEVDHPCSGRLKYPDAPYKLSASPSRLERSAPLLGQHNSQIYGDRLGYDKHDLVRMAEVGII
jgi:crotonobetainyl-CoA:carnitine CoA-transferase CaiB-like acyl-CoA transferase